MTDVAYIVGPQDVTSNEELRYSLRSVETNLKRVGDVVMYGHVPNWVKARSKSSTRCSRNKLKDARNHLEIACGDPALSDPFWLFNDDFFVMQEMETIPVVHRGHLLKQKKVTFQMKKAATILKEMRAPAPFMYYECHTPILVWKRVMRLVLAGTSDRALVKTIYMNLMGMEGVHFGNAKVYASTPRVWEKWPLLSTTNGTFATGDVGHFIRDRFPNPSRWEWQNGPGLP